MAVSELEHDKLFDHEYDGIREYDNPMPKWWVYIFALTVAFCGPYVLRYHFGPGPSIQDKLENEKQAYANLLVATYGDLQPDVPTLVNYMSDEVAMTGMAGLFKGKCAQCHLADGSGSVGPNLTDDTWISVKAIDDIPRIVSTGVPEKGMPAWQDQLTQTQIVLLSSYVATLRDNPLAGKEAQGTPVPPWPALGDLPVAEPPDGGDTAEAAGDSS